MRWRELTEENVSPKPKRKLPHKTIQKQTHQKISARKVARQVLDIHSEGRREREREREHKKKIGSSRRDDTMHGNPANKNKKPDGTHDAMCGNPAKNKTADAYSLPPISSSTFSWQNCHLLPLTHPPSLLLPLFLASLMMGAVLCTFLPCPLFLYFLRVCSLIKVGIYVATHLWYSSLLCVVVLFPDCL